MLVEVIRRRWAHGALLPVFFTAFLLGSGALLCSPWLKGAAASEEKEGTAGAWAFLTGYGTSHPGMGKTRTRVETIDLVARYERILIDNLGSSWYQGDHSLLLELPLHLIVSPEVAPMIGANFLACWTFSAADILRPYIFAGGGPLYMTTDIQGMGTRLNGNYQFGGGLRYRTGGDRYLKFEYRFHHVSNGGRKEPNDPLNSSKFLVGMTF
jgi:lipid A 3-O-deacylase